MSKAMNWNDIRKQVVRMACAIISGSTNWTTNVSRVSENGIFYYIEGSQMLSTYLVELVAKVDGIQVVLIVSIAS